MPATASDDGNDLAELAVELAVAAGQLAMRRRRDGFAVSTKSTATDLVTEVDRAVEAWVIGELATRRPADGVLAEEGGTAVTRSGVRWIIDPIDGTVNFALGLPDYAVSVGVEREGVIVAGCVACPERGDVYRAQLGRGAFVTDRWGEQTHLTGPRSITLERAVIGTGFAYSSATRARQAAVVAALLPGIGDIRRIGSAALDLCAVAAGRLDAYFEAGLSPWDRAAGLLIATEAGCVTSGLRGRPADQVITCVARPDLAPALFAALEALDADDVLPPG